MSGSRGLGFRGLGVWGFRGLGFRDIEFWDFGLCLDPPTTLSGSL